MTFLAIDKPCDQSFAFFVSPFLIDYGGTIVTRVSSLHALRYLQIDIPGEDLWGTLKVTGPCKPLFKIPGVCRGDY